ncbi:MAG TPA: polysaccharide lyase family 8 super-sandwich domain-containing protein [Thermoanaerobaculia bacterium]|nr:polysaccharide lyase family 8 super-sandwich domain-containing protein [Thermoanaerobaculia bacterium]
MKRSLILLLVLAAPLRAADIDTVRANFVGYYTAAGADRSTPMMQNALASLENAARATTAAGFLLSDGSWSDIDYSEMPSGSWGPWDHAKRLTTMAKAYNTPGQSLYHDPLLLTQITAALQYADNFYGITKLPLGNWWFWTIGVPLDLGPTLVMMRGQIPQATYDALVQDIALRIGSSTTARGIVGPIPIGENLVWSAFTHLCLGLLKDDATILAGARDAMASVTYPTAGDGVQADASFHQHGPQLYTGGYGGSFAYSVAQYAMITRGTAFGLPPAALNAFADYVADGIVWSLYGNYFDPSVMGRQAIYRSTTGFNGIAALVQAAQFDSPRVAEIRAAAARMLQSWPWGLPAELAGAGVLVQRMNVAAAWPSGHRHYYTSDYTVHRRPAWFASIRMFSTRTKSGESTNNEDLLGSRQSDGRMFLTMSGSEYNGSDVWPALDWTRLPGITVEQSPAAADATYGFGTRAIAGGTGDGRNGVSAMEVEPLNSSLTARKSWFFFDDAIVFLTNSISDPSAYRVETVVNQWPTAAPLASGSNWIQADNVGYWFPSGMPLTRRDTRTGLWAQLGGSTDTTPVTKTFLTLWFDHGTTPNNAAAEYAVVPNVSAAAMSAWAASSPFTIVANNASVSAVRNNRDSAIGLVFWTPSSVLGYQSDAAATVYITQNGTTLNLSAADPTCAATGSLHITIPGRYAGAGATLNINRTIIEVPRNGGRTFTTKLKPAPGKMRAVRR